MDDYVNSDVGNKNSVSPASPSVKKEKKRPQTKGVRKTEEFKKAYRQFYDDVKISDREDW